MGMYDRTIKIEADKDKLLETLKANRKTHIADFKEAMEGFLTQVQAALHDRKTVFEKAAADFKKADGDISKVKTPNLDFGKYPKPSSHEKDYDRAISMLEMHTGKTFIIDMDMYRQYVEDEWDWKRGFELSNSTYKG
jgi:hypothetical protein